jgi:hypothetical protein
LSPSPRRPLPKSAAKRLSRLCALPTRFHRCGEGKALLPSESRPSDCRQGLLLTERHLGLRPRRSRRGPRQCRSAPSFAS